MAADFNVEIIEKEFVALKKPVIIEGFPSVGLVGAIATEFIASKLKMDEIGFIKSPYLPPITLIKEGIPRPPIRFYAKDNLVAIVSDTAVPSELVLELSEKIVEWALHHNAKEVVSLGGIAAADRDKEKKPKVYTVSPYPEMLKVLKKEYPPVKLGFLTGVYGVLMLECFEKNVPSYGYLADAHFEYPDPLAAASVVEAVSKKFSLKIDNSSLIKTSDAMEKRLSKLLAQTKKELTKAQPTFYR